MHFIVCAYEYLYMYVHAKYMCHVLPEAAISSLIMTVLGELYVLLCIALYRLVSTSSLLKPRHYAIH